MDGNQTMPYQSLELCIGTPFPNMMFHHPLLSPKFHQLYLKYNTSLDKSLQFPLPINKKKKQPTIASRVVSSTQDNLAHSHTNSPRIKNEEGGEICFLDMYPQICEERKSGENREGTILDMH